jgi:hypothetical protein
LSFKIGANVKGLAMPPEFMAPSARLQMPGKGKFFQVKIYCPIDFRPPELKPNSSTSAQWHFCQASHMAMLAAALVACSL